ncbi:putative endo-1,3(4)-beta-glucanase [Tolypocladium ophioglossoides CBS 100239]|uniref:Putative endo-1,3(4)-beta-glucanase n=1 Tax=Tolypocladium ophioglossoides (strain CBS 100239) TaxID=1163406 RepID=A0A0L0N6W1_TOLOC|nr:putative endo-1,3(4)-beta-glucanase [Tolypocladium ophioglossoides CBS 100239]
MAPSLLSLGTAALACAGGAVATKWQLTETYDATNFFDKFDFITGASPNGGLVNFQSKADALNKGLVAYQGNEVYMGVDYHTVVTGSNRKRDSVRIESKARYNHGLFIARFTHLPENKCGLWPAFWTYGENWPVDGEVDIIEQWNNAQWNQPAIHMADSAKYGQCLMDGVGQSGNVLTSNCDNDFQDPPIQWGNQGCVAADHSGPWATRDGVAMEWTSEFIKLYSWHWSNVPSNIGDDAPDSASWGTPVVYLKNKQCDIDDHFSNQKLVLDLDFCGNPAGNPSVWASSCAAVTKQETCEDYISNFPGDFSEAFFKLKDIRYFEAAKPATSTTSCTSTKTTSTLSSKTTTTSSSKTTTASSSKATTTSSTKTSSSSSSSSSSTSVTSKTTQTQATTSSAAASNSISSTLVRSSRWTNSSSTAVPTTATSSVDLTTSTVYTTTVHTVTKCPPWVTDCPAGGYVTTETIALYTTVCPVTATQKPTTTTTATATASQGAGKETITTKVTKTYTITSCAPTVTNCPVGKVITEVLTTTYCPGEQTPGVPYVTGPGSPSASSAAPAKATSSSFTAPSPFQPGQTTAIYLTQTVVPQPTPSGPSGNNNNNNGNNNNGNNGNNSNGNNSNNNNSNSNSNSNSNNTAIVSPSSTTSVPGSEKPPVSEPCRGDNCPPKTVVSGAVKTSFGALVVLCAAAALML